MKVKIMRSAWLSLYSGDILHGWALHLVPYKENRVWGFEVGWGDGPGVDFGLGPLFRFQRH